MTIEQARIIADVKGWTGGAGGYIRDGERVICQGWAQLAILLTRAGMIRDGRIDWRRMDLTRDLIRTLRAHR